MLANPAANAIAAIGIGVSSTSAFARCTRRVVATAVGEAPACRTNSWAGTYGPALGACTVLQAVAASMILLGPGRGRSTG